jgi:hypothetical protein
MKREVRTFENVYARAEVRRSYSPLLELIEIPLALVGGALSSVSTVLVWIVATPFYHWFYLAPCMVSTGLPRGEFSFEKCFQRDWPKEQPDPAAYLTLFLPGIAVGLIMAANESEDVNAGAALGLFGIIAGMLSFNLHLTALPVAYYKTALFLLRPAWLFALPALLGDPERLIDPTRNAFAWEFVRPAGEVRRVQAREEGPLVPDSEARISKVHLEFRSTDGRPLYRDELDANMNGDLTLDLGRFESLSATSSGLIVEATVLEGEYQAEARMEIDSASLKRMFSK